MWHLLAVPTSTISESSLHEYVIFHQFVKVSHYKVLGIRVHIIWLMLSTWKVQLDEMAKLEVWLRQGHAVLRLSRPRVSEQSKSLGG